MLLATANAAKFAQICPKLGYVLTVWTFNTSILFFSQCSTLLVGIRFCRHVPNSTKNKNMKFLNPYLLQKMVFLASKTLLSPFGTRLSRRGRRHVERLRLPTDIHRPPCRLPRRLGEWLWQTAVADAHSDNVFSDMIFPKDI
jgi:hypothetical protein